MSKTCTCQNISEKDKHEIKDANPSWLSPKASQLAAKVLEESRGQGFFKCAMYAIQNRFERISCSAADVRRFPSLHSDESFEFSVFSKWFLCFLWLGVGMTC